MCLAFAKVAVETDPHM